MFCSDWSKIDVISRKISENFFGQLGTGEGHLYTENTVKEMKLQAEDLNIDVLSPPEKVNLLWRRGSAVKISSTFPTGAKIQVLLTCEWSGSLTMRFSVSLHVDKKLLVRIWSLFVGTFFFRPETFWSTAKKSEAGSTDLMQPSRIENRERVTDLWNPLNILNLIGVTGWPSWVNKNPQATNPVDSCFRSPAVRVA